MWFELRVKHDNMKHSRYQYVATQVKQLLVIDYLMLLKLVEITVESYLRNSSSVVFDKDLAVIDPGILNRMIPF